MPDEADRVIWAQSVEDAVEYLQNTEGKILITTGSKELIKYTKLTEYKERCFARVLSTEQAVMESVALGFEGKHLIAMQGPFSKEMNVATIHQTGAKYFVTKESGKAGGFGEKVQAAKETGAVLVAVGRQGEHFQKSVNGWKRICNKSSENSYGEIKSEIRKADGEDESDRFALCS